MTKTTTSHPYCLAVAAFLLSPRVLGHVTAQEAADIVRLAARRAVGRSTTAVFVGREFLVNGETRQTIGVAADGFDNLTAIHAAAGRFLSVRPVSATIQNVDRSVTDGVDAVRKVGRARIMAATRPFAALVA